MLLFLPLRFHHVSFQQKGTEIRECVNVVFVPNVAVTKLYSGCNIWIMWALNHCAQRFWTSVCGFDFHGNKRFHCPDEEILFQSGIFFFIIFWFVCFNMNVFVLHNICFFCKKMRELLHIFYKKMRELLYVLYKNMSELMLEFDFNLYESFLYFCTLKKGRGLFGLTICNLMF